jgi:hypothetical protein
MDEVFVWLNDHDGIANWATVAVAIAALFAKPLVRATRWVIAAFRLESIAMIDARPWFCIACMAVACVCIAHLTAPRRIEDGPTIAYSSSIAPGPGCVPGSGIATVILRGDESRRTNQEESPVQAPFATLH